MQGARPVDWIVMRNRLSSLAARNKRDMATVIEALAKRVGFRVAAGLSERVIYRELFLSGLTLLDLKRGSGPSLTMSHVAARQEVRDLVAALNLPPRDAHAPSAARATAASTQSQPAAG
jgi:chromosome partitioning protein